MYKRCFFCKQISLTLHLPEFASLIQNRGVTGREFSDRSSRSASKVFQTGKNLSGSHIIFHRLKEVTLKPTWFPSCNYNMRHFKERIFCYSRLYLSNFAEMNICCFSTVKKSQPMRQLIFKQQILNFFTELLRKDLTLVSVLSSFLFFLKS